MTINEGEIGRGAIKVDAKKKEKKKDLEDMNQRVVAELSVPQRMWFSSQPAVSLFFGRSLLVFLGTFTLSSVLFLLALIILSSAVLSGLILTLVSFLSLHYHCTNRL